jgi:hypothetical protein
MRESGM